MRNVGAVVAGIVVLGLVVVSLQWVGSALHPLPPGLDPTDPAAFATYVATMPFAAWALACASELMGAFLGALTAVRLASTRPTWLAGGIVGVALAGSISNWVSFPHPMWFIIGQLAGYPLVFFAASKFGRRLSQ